jgi:hypothetical protein
MWELEPGPIVREEMPLPPAIFYPGRLARHLELIVDELGASDVVLGGHQHDIAGNRGDGLDALYASTIGAAADADANHPPADADQTAHVLVDAGAGTEVYRQSVLRYLPQPDAPVPEDYIPPVPNVIDYPGEKPPDYVDVIQSIGRIDSRVTALEHGTKTIVPPQPGAPPRVVAARQRRLTRRRASSICRRMVKSTTPIGNFSAGRRRSRNISISGRCATTGIWASQRAARLRIIGAPASPAAKAGHARKGSLHGT